MAKKTSEVVVSLKDKVTARLKKLQKEFQKLTGTLTKIGTVGAGVTAFFGAKFLAGAIKSSADFQEQMSTVAAVTNAGADELRALESAADQAGTKTRFTATEAAQGLEELVRAGQNSKEAIQTLNPVLQLAQANNIAVADSATLVTTTLNQYGKEADYAATATDILTRGTQTSAQNIEQLSNALEFAGPQARQMGLDLETTTAVIGKLADQGFRGEKGGTALRNTLIELQNPASNFNKELAGLDITSTDFVEVLQQLADKGDLSQAALLSLGKRAGPAITALVNGGVDELGALIGTLRDAGGAAEDAAAKMDNNLPGALKSFQSAFDAARRQLANPLLDVFQTELSEVTGKIREFVSSGAIGSIGTKLAEAFQVGITAVKTFVSEFSLEQVVQKTRDFLSGTADVFRVFVENSKAAASGAKLVWDGFGLVFDSIKAAATGAAAGFIELIIQYKALSVASLENAKATREWLGLDVSSFTDKIAETKIQIGGLKAAQDALFETTRAGIEGAKENWAQLKGSADQAAESIKRTAPAIKEVAGETAEAAEETKRLGDVFWDAYNAGKEGARGVAGAVDDMSSATADATADVQTLQHKVTDLGANIREQLAKDADAARTAFETALDSQTATLQQKQAAFIAYAETAIAANGGVVSSELQQQAAILGTTEQLENLRQKIAEVKREQTGSNADLRQQVAGVGEAADESSRKFGEMSDQSRQAAAGLGGFIANIVNSWKSLNESAAEFVTVQMAKMTRHVQSTLTFLSKLAALTKTMAFTQREQEGQLERITQRYQEQGNAVQFLREATDFLRKNVLLLDQAKLTALQSQIDSVRASMEAFRETTVDALQSAQRELLGLKGSELEILQADAAAKIAELKAQIAQAPDAESRRNLEAAIRLQQEILQIREEQLKKSEQDRAEQEAQAALLDAAASQASAAPTPAPSTPVAVAAVSAPVQTVADPFAGSTGSQTVTIRLIAPDGLTSDLLARDEDIANRVIEILGQLGQVTTGGA